MQPLAIAGPFDGRKDVLPRLVPDAVFNVRRINRSSSLRRE